MLYMPLERIQPGMVVAKPVCHGKNRAYFVQKGFSLSAQTLKRLEGLGVHHLWVACPGAEDVQDRVNDRVIEKRQELASVLTESVAELRNRTDATIDCKLVESRVGDLLTEILEDRRHEPVLVEMQAGVEDLVRHLTNCCYISLLLGTHLAGYVRHQRRRMPERLAEDVRQLGVGAFIHDIGKARQPEEIRSIHALHPDEENADFQSHARVGFEMVRGRISALASYVVAHHHQRYDGRGFPKIRHGISAGPTAPLYSDKIHVFARIVAVADAFDHLLHDAEGGARPTIEALYNIQQKSVATRFDPIVIAALNRLIPPFMLGSIVQLSNGAHAVVVQNHTDAPCYPTVRIAHGKPGTPDFRVDPDDIDLRAEVTNVAFVDGLDVSSMLYQPPHIDDGVMAYWGLRSPKVQALHVDPAAFVEENAATEPASPAST